MRTSTTLRLATALLAAAGCSDVPRGADPGNVPGEPAEDEAFRALEGRTFERGLVFVATGGDTLLAVPWLLGARVGAEGVHRTVRGSILRGTAWDPLFETSWEDPPTRAPWRIVPREGMRIVVGSDDVLERLVYGDGEGGLELVLGETLSEWSGPRGGTYRVLEGSLLVGPRPSEGLMLDVSRSRGPGEPPSGDWAFLVSGDSLQVVLHSPRRAAPGSGAWVGWARLDFRELRWPVLAVVWPEVRAFERARRDVPVAWRVTAPGDEVVGELSAVGVRLEAGEGEGPQLPLSGLYGVTGTLTVEGGTYPVRGILHHRQG